MNVTYCICCILDVSKISPPTEIVATAPTGLKRPTASSPIRILVNQAAMQPFEQQYFFGRFTAMQRRHVQTTRVLGPLRVEEKSTGRQSSPTRVLLEFAYRMSSCINIIRLYNSTIPILCDKHVSKYLYQSLQHVSKYLYQSLEGSHTPLPHPPMSLGIGPQHSGDGGVRANARPLDLDGDEASQRRHAPQSG